jgi:VanZ family protein
LMIFTISGGIAFGIITEITQKLSPGRSFNLLDILYNCIGIITGTAVIYLMSKTKNTSPIVPPPFPKGGGQGVGS